MQIHYAKPAVHLCIFKVLDIYRAWIYWKDSGDFRFCINISWYSLTPNSVMQL